MAAIFVISGNGYHPKRIKKSEIQDGRFQDGYN